jgi:VanZ family protein
VELFRAITKWFWPFVLAAMIVVASSRSQVAAPGLVAFDKVAHFSLFGLLATLVARNGGSAPRGCVAVLLVSLFGLTDEWHQSFTPGRTVEVADWAADTFGAMVAVALYVRWARYRDWLEMPLCVRQRRIEKPAPLVPNQSV